MSLSEGLAFVFDLDGVIVDSMPLHNRSWRVYFERLNIDITDLDRRTHGRRNDDIVRDFIGAHLTPEEVAAHGAAKEALYRAIAGPDLESYLVPGVTDFLARHSRDPMAVASNAETPNVDFVLDGTGLRGYFKVIVDGLQVKRPKPFPDVYLKAADLLGVEPKNCLVFEDSPAGVQAATAACARVVGVETHEPLEELEFRVRDFRDPAIERWVLQQKAR
jgi:beta-phosphoglucomutase